MINIIADLKWLTSGPITSGIWGLFAVISVALVFSALLILWVWMLMDAFGNKKLTSLSRILWITFIFTTYVGAFVYFLTYSPRWNKITQ